VTHNPYPPDLYTSGGSALRQRRRAVRGCLSRRRAKLLARAPRRTTAAVRAALPSGAGSWPGRCRLDRHYRRGHPGMLNAPAGLSRLRPSAAMTCAGTGERA